MNQVACKAKCLTCQTLPNHMTPPTNFITHFKDIFPATNQTKDYTAKYEKLCYYCEANSY